MRRSQVIVALSIVFILLLLSTFSYMSDRAYKPVVTDQGLNLPPSTASVMITCSDGSCQIFEVEIADSSEEHATGLMNRTALAANSGMLFIFSDYSAHNFWMDNTLIPLDMIFIDGDGKILNIHENATPLSREIIRSAGPCKYVLEVNGGVCGKENIRTGDSFVIIQ